MSAVTWKDVLAAPLKTLFSDYIRETSRHLTFRTPRAAPLGSGSSALGAPLRHP